MFVGIFINILFYIDIDFSFQLLSIIAKASSNVKKVYIFIPNQYVQELKKNTLRTCAVGPKVIVVFTYLRLRTKGDSLNVYTLHNVFVQTYILFHTQLPLVRSSLYAQGSTLHISLWPGQERMTRDITRFVAKEGRLFSMAVSGLFGPEAIGENLLHQEKTKEFW